MINEYRGLGAGIILLKRHVGFQNIWAHHARIISSSAHPGLVGLVAVGAIYQIGSWSADASRTIAGSARTVSDLNR